jgi:hypothetical protein
MSQLHDATYAGVAEVLLILDVRKLYNTEGILLIFRMKKESAVLSHED